MAEGNSCRSRLALLFICGDLISNDQKTEILHLIDKSFRSIDKEKFSSIEKHLENLIESNNFPSSAENSSYRQILHNDDGSIVGFLYFPNFHTVVNVFKEIFSTSNVVSIVFLGQQIDSTGAWIFSDCSLTVEHFLRIFDENSSTIVTEDLQIILPFVSTIWSRFVTNFLSKRLKKVELNEISTNEQNENPFGQNFLQNFRQIFAAETNRFDLNEKLIPRENAGAVAFDEPNLYVFYGQQGEASLFAIRGFVLLINGGFSRIPSFWNFVRGLQTIDACILTHYDHDVLPGFQSLFHRKIESIDEQNRSCKPDVTAVFLNSIQRTKIQTSAKKMIIPQSKLLVNLSQNIEQFLNDVKKLNVDTFDLIKQTTPAKPTIEPINLFRKIAFGSLDLYVLHPTSNSVEDEKILSNIQKIPIRDHQPSPSIIPLHHWFSSCFLLVWTPTSKMTKESRIRILFTGACPQTLVFEALNRSRHLDVLHENKTKISSVSTPTKSQGKTSTRSTIPTRPASVSLTTNPSESLVQSNRTTPIDDLTSKLLPLDPMTTSFIDGRTNSPNPFDIVHHQVDSTELTSIDEIQPQGLPMNSNRPNSTATATTTTMTSAVRKNKTNLPTGSIFYVDVAYIPFHGDEHYVDREFFRRIRARYYVLNAVDIHRLTLESLLDGKQQWEKGEQQQPVTLVPTFDGDQLRQFFVMNKTRLQDLNVNILPASTRCHVQYDDQTSPAQRLRFPSS